MECVEELPLWECLVKRLGPAAPCNGAAGLMFRPWYYDCGVESSRDPHHKYARV